jgi:hypothetical protein
MVSNGNDSYNSGDKAMAVVEKIQQYVQKLPALFQAEALDFIEYLLIKAERYEAEDWAELSLASARRGMENEDAPVYTLADLKVVFAS